VPWVMIMPVIDSSFRYFSQVSANFFQSFGFMSSENFMKGLVNIGLQIFLSSGAIFRIASLSVEITPPDFGSSLDEIVPPVITRTIFGSSCRSLRLSVASLVGRFACRSLRLSVTWASRISFSLIPML